jgi:hypothetical protein
MPAKERAPADLAPPGRARETVQLASQMFQYGG